MPNKFGHGIIEESEGKFIGFWQLCSTSWFRYSGKYSAGISVSEHHIPGAATGHGNNIQFEDFISCKVGKIEATEENQLISSSAAKEVNARKYLSQV